jgi:RNA polymerase sigma-70 factor (ECF subfamily)
MKLTDQAKNQDKKSEEALLREFSVTGNLEVLGELYNEYMPLVYGVCLKYLKNRDDSKDAVMHIFEKLIVDIPRQKIENFRSWLYVVTKNYCLMQLRSQKATEEKAEEWMNNSVIFMENNNDPHPIDEDITDIDKALKDCIERLKAEQKECINQFYYQNRCYNEIASNLRLDEKKVKSHLQNAKRNLKICLEEKHARK